MPGQCKRQAKFYQEGDGVMSDELVLVSVAVTTFVSSFRIVVMIFLPLKIIGTSVEAVSVTVVMKVVLDSSVDHVGVGVTRMLRKFGGLRPREGVIIDHDVIVIMPLGGIY